ncbi:MAG: 5'/3'-nucleotidase SurE [Bacillota bacterium]|uniref:5'-nucleotidase SurE n=1 Tax=Virgibacillus salarius TaxID=447199 RepID=A0A941DXD7_9BACI|nr:MULTISPECIES: 5'/3'-nucleotidase SurE [Bacillaceae]NAZ09895.1 5'/3'-nucleotidase SurE [Agaribacter marinus]MBR7797186.1 5'/3'-nucleotidase SurE [Virgibacillus salarius]MCC2252669.1 5'/3'-nucleotidase SurE [Virgibacillus sp. AGTR]MDY7046682.1 5'/3'-nucleotidase SurE [Virgibacillus sp. M23]QRZ19240.1 5'/3'-nucleotidase SurE [Virgibacillus sp. AGTR]
MKILITNDDGIFAPGVQALADLLSHFGEVTVVCPETEKSAYSHKITLRQPLKLKKVDFASHAEAFAVNGSPADCVKLGMEVLLPEKPDIVFSGINIGPNVGRDLYYSGTIAAAQEAMLYQVPSVSVSLETFDSRKIKFDIVKQLLYQVVEVIVQNKIPKNLMLNVNLPYTSKELCKGVRVVPMDLSVSRYNFAGLNDPHGHIYYWLKDHYHELELNEGTDYHLLREGYVTISPIELVHTRKRRIDQLTRWFYQYTNLQEEK